MKLMRRFICLGIMLYVVVTYGQKKTLDIKAYKHWPQVKNAILSPDKQYLVYQLTDSIAVLYHVKTKISDTVIIPIWNQHLLFAFDSVGRLVFKSLLLRPKPEHLKRSWERTDVWCWKDTILQSARLYQLSAADSFLVVNLYNFVTKQIYEADTVPFSQQELERLDRWKVKLKRSLVRKLARKFAADSIRIVGELSKRKIIIEVSSIVDPANLFLSTKFKKVEVITDVNPQKEYNWYSADIIPLHAPVGALDKGILYRPEDFDSTKKYPVILCLTDNKPLYSKDNFYSYLLSGMDTLNQPYLYNDRLIPIKGTGLYAPILSNGGFNIAYFVSNGYVVLELPSVIEIGRPGPAMLERVRGAVTTLRDYNWVDTAHLGIQGQGTSAYFVNFIIAQTSLFKAAEASAGVTNLISHYCSIDGRGESMQPFYDGTTGFFGKTLWEDSASYIQQSAVIHASDINTPLMIMHNKEDNIISFAQGVELFTAMRRLGNRCWMLQYDHEGHVLCKTEDQEDFTLRMHQFFDHYLKGKGAPIWMTRGIAAKMKGITSGFEIDTEIKTPPIGGLLNDVEYKKRFGNRPRDKSMFDFGKH